MPQSDWGLISERELNLMSNLQLVNPKAEVMRRSQALAVNVSAAKGLQDVMRTNLGAFAETRWGSDIVGSQCLVYSHRSGKISLR